MAPTLVLLHGFTQTRQSWRPVIAALGGHRRALAPDLPGHGLAAARPASFAACTGYVRALGGERFALAGYSMGGRIALHAAFALADRLDRLVLVGASPGIADAAEEAASGRSCRCGTASPSASAPPRTPTGCATRPKGSPPPCAGSAPA